MRTFRLCHLTFLLLASCGNSPAQQVQDPAFDRVLQGLLSGNVPTTGVQMLARQPAPVLLDARERREYDVSHLPGAHWVGHDDFQRERLADLPLDTTIVVYCSVGYRSEQITEQLVAAGFTDVRNLYGGIFEWMNSGHNVVDSLGPTDRVHAYDQLWGRWLEKGEKVY